MKNPDQSPIERLLEHIKEYLIAQLKVVLTDASKKGGTVVYGIALAIIFAVLGWFFIMILSIGIAFGIASLIESLFWGFMIVAGIYLLIGLLIWVFREKLLRTPILLLFLKLANTDKPEAHERDR
ncbi:MAG: phage holin family protein [Cyclobacteriaceae bacterium]